VPVPEEVVRNGYTEGRDGSEDVVHVERVDQRRVDGEVDDVAARSHDRELDQLDPVRRLAQAAADPERMVRGTSRWI
jgi:hypothetical protein